MNERTAAAHPRRNAAPKGAGRTDAFTHPRSATGDQETRYAGAISMAAALGGILLSMDKARPR